MDSVLKAERLAKTYHGFSLRDVSLEIPPGSIVGLFGPTGAGKTTLMKLLARQIPAESGIIRVFGLDYEDRETDIKNRVGIVPQEPVFYRDRSVEYNARFAASFYEKWDGGAFYRMLDEFRIIRETTFKRLSRGQKTLFALALALSHGADLLLLDEPAAGLDILLRRSLLERLRRFVSDGERSVLVSSHITDGLEDVSEVVYFLDAGRLLHRAEKDELMARWKRIHYKEGTLPPSLIAELSDVQRQPFGSSGLTRDFPSLKQRLESGIARGDVIVENAGLDDILIAMHQGE
jgi:ABC-2 type transport system ATP-binding protein